MGIGNDEDDDHPAETAKATDAAFAMLQLRLQEGPASAAVG